MILHAKFEGKPGARKNRAEEQGSPGGGAPSHAAKNLALAHHIDRLIEKELIADYTHAARLLGVSQPRMTHLMSLVLLAPQVQETILLARCAPGDKELRRLARIPEWSEQLAALPNSQAHAADSVP